MTRPGASPGRRVMVGPNTSDIETPGPAPVKIYHLAPEELAQYGPPKENPKKTSQGFKSITRQELEGMFAVANTFQDAAKKLGVSEGQLRKLCSIHRIRFGDYQQKGDGKVMQETKATMDIAREKLPKEILGNLFAAGQTQKKIATDHDLPAWAVAQLKKNYWPKGFKVDKAPELEEFGVPKPITDCPRYKAVKVMAILYPQGVAVSQYADFIEAVDTIIRLCLEKPNG